MSFLSAVLIVQIITVGIAAFVLKGVLNNMLIGQAVRHLEGWNFSDASSVEHVVMITHKPLSGVFKDRVQRAVKKVFPSMRDMDFRVWKLVWGGAVLRVEDQVIDCSLRDRLNQAVKGEGYDRNKWLKSIGDHSRV